LQTSITLVLEQMDPELSRAHRELYPERIAEHIPFSLTLHYPWLPADEVTEAELARLRRFFVGRPRLEFQLTRKRVPRRCGLRRAGARRGATRDDAGALGDVPGVPSVWRAWVRPATHATLGRYEGPTPITLEQAKERVEPLLPVHCMINEATLQEEYEPDRLRIRETFPFAAA
jgi:hypothetical protein